jgi:hypothetical protein
MKETYKTSFEKICPSCGVGNPSDASNCILCDRDLSETVLFLEDAFFDLELTQDELVEYRKNFYRTRRTGKVMRYTLKDMDDVEFGHPVKRFIFEYHGERVVLPLEEGNYERLKETLEALGIKFKNVE